MNDVATAPTEPAPDDGHCCRCPDVAPWDQWIDPKAWLDADGALIESRSCAVCGCTRSRLTDKTPAITVLRELAKAKREYSASTEADRSASWHRLLAAHERVTILGEMLIASEAS